MAPCILVIYRRIFLFTVGGRSECSPFISEILNAQNFTFSSFILPNGAMLRHWRGNCDLNVKKLLRELMNVRVMCVPWCGWRFFNYNLQKTQLMCIILSFISDFFLPCIYSDLFPLWDWTIMSCIASNFPVYNLLRHL